MGCGNPPERRGDGAARGRGVRRRSFLFVFQFSVLGFLFFSILVSRLHFYFSCFVCLLFLLSFLFLAKSV